MGGAVMFLIAVSAAFVSTSIANAGVTYGWTPDGGQGVKYIIQIPPSEVDQVVRSGEITSQVPREIRGHVSEVVIQIGNGSLPRVTPSNLAQADYSSTSPNRTTNQLASEDRSPMPIPAMPIPPVNGTMPLSPIRNPDAATAMMKPAPQAGGMNFPGGLGLPSTTPSRGNTPMPSTAANNLQNGFGNAGRTLQQAARDSLNNAGNQLRNSASNAFQNTQSAVNQTVDRMGQSANLQMQAAADAAARAATGANREATTGLLQPDDPRARLGQNNSAARDPQTLSNNPYARAATSVPNTDPRDPRSNASPNASPNASSNANNQADDDWYDLRNGSRRRPSTDPVNSGLANGTGTEPRSPSLFENSNFGRMPGGLDTDRNSFAADSQRGNPNDPRSTNVRNMNTQQDNTERAPTQRAPTQGNSTQGNSGNRFAADDTSNLDYDSRLTAAEARRLPPGGYSFDNEGYPIDRQGYRLNPYGQRTNENQTNRSNQSPFGQDRLAASDSNQSLNNTNSFGRDNDPRFSNNSNNFKGSTYATSNQLVQPPSANQFPAGTQPSNYQNGPYPQGQPYQQPGQFQQPGQYQQPGPYQQVGQYPVSPTNPGVNPYTNLAATGAGPAGYPSLNDPRLISFNGQGIGTKPQADPSTASTTSSGNSTGLDGRDGLLNRDSRPSDSRDRFGSALEDPDAVAAQPIFNGMLLLSVVTNVYLLFWLKNLRLQFRDNVASRRAASNNTPVVASM